MARVLVVEDERDVQQLVKAILEKDGHEVVSAFDGAEALQRLQTGDLPQVIVLDIMMPQMDGYTFINRLHEDVRTRSLPVVVLTAKGHLKEVFEQVSNVTAYVRKPFEPKALLKNVREALAKART